MGNQYTDIRVIQLARENECSPPKNSSSWMMLGHFRWAYITDLTNKLSKETKVDLDGIRQYNLSLVERKKHKKSYCQPIYILREFCEIDKEYVSYFWSKPATFMLITRVHSTLLDQSSFEEILDSCMGDFKKNLGDAPLSENVIYIRYRTLDLSDEIIVMKSDSVLSLMAALGRLYSEKAVGDMYSYYCVRNIERTKLVDDQNAIKNDSTIMASIRFSVRDARKTETFLEKMLKLDPFREGADEKIFFVTGVDDINAIALNISSYTLCTLINFLYSEIHTEETPWELAVDDATTRVGIPKNNLVICEQNTLIPDQQEKLYKVYKAMRDKVIDATPTNSVKDWHRTLIELLDSLMDISINCVLNQVSFILLGPVRGIVERVLSYSMEESEIENALNEFLAGISYVMEHIFRMEGELVYQPETRPLLYDIPASILEFDLAFSDRCARYLRQREKKCVSNKSRNADKREYAFLLVPKLYKNITIHDNFNRHGDDLRLLYVEVPLSLMYNPFNVACNLVHEVAHHCGKITRLRSKRLTRLCYCAAVLLAEEIGLVENNIFVNILYQEVSSSVAIEIDKKGLENQIYMKNVLPILIKVMKKLYCTEEKVIGYLDLCYNEMSGRCTEDLFDKPLELYRNSIETGLNEEFGNQMYQVSLLFTECYADIAMKSLLSLSNYEYLSLFINDYERFVQDIECKENQKENIEKLGFTATASYVSLIERVSLVLCSVNSNTLEVFPQMLGDVTDHRTSMEAFIEDIYLFCKVFLSSKLDERNSANMPKKGAQGMSCYHPFCVLDAVRDYLIQCYNEMVELEQDEGNLFEKKEIENSFAVFAKQKRLASDDIFSELANYRKRILSECYEKFVQAR